MRPAPSRVLRAVLRSVFDGVYRICIGGTSALSEDGEQCDQSGDGAGGEEDPGTEPDPNAVLLQPSVEDVPSDRHGDDERNGDEQHEFSDELPEDLAASMQALLTQAGSTTGEV